jgi:hypothetical protein
LIRRQVIIYISFRRCLYYQGFWIFFSILSHLWQWQIVWVTETVRTFFGELPE